MWLWFCHSNLKSRLISIAEGEKLAYQAAAVGYLSLSDSAARKQLKAFYIFFFGGTF
jgi:hypothetical protein